MLTLCPAQIQDLAIRCVQKNIKKNKGVKDWPWWKLFTTVRPLIEVQLTEDQIRGKDVGIHAGGCWMEQGGLGGALVLGRAPQWVGMRESMVGSHAEANGGVGCRIPQWGGIQDRAVGWETKPREGWDKGSCGVLGYRIPQWAGMQEPTMG